MYYTEQNKKQKFYLITKLGCDLVVVKLAGHKGNLFADTYIKQFYAMEEQLKAPRN
jgi:phage regulator Rha-like protein